METKEKEEKKQKRNKIRKIAVGLSLLGLGVIGFVGLYKTGLAKKLLQKAKVRSLTKPETLPVDYPCSDSPKKTLINPTFMKECGVSTKEKKFYGRHGQRIYR